MTWSQVKGMRSPKMNKLSKRCRYVAYGGLYTLLEIFAVPAIPLTMTAGILFGRLPGIVVVSGASTLAATLAFLIARYAARDKVCLMYLFHFPLRNIPCLKLAVSSATALEVGMQTKTCVLVFKQTSPVKIGGVVLFCYYYE